MATIPIEVIIQDAESPVTPTPESGEETNITVPDTGTISDVNNSGGIGSSVSSIILPATILVLALCALVALLVRRQQKRKKSNTGAEGSNAKLSKKEKLFTATSGTIAILAATALVGNLVIPATKAATSDVEDGIVPAEDKVSIVVTRDGGVAEASMESTATITSTSDFGYKVLLSMAEGVDTGNLYLDGDENSEYYIAPAEVNNEESETEGVEGTELTDNTWGYALEEDGDYSAMPLLDNAATVAQGDEPVEDELLSIYYGVKVSSDLPAGTYSGGEMEYYFVTLEPSNVSELTYMQDFAKLSTDAKASVLRSMTEGEQYTLKDSRDQKDYYISKLADGNVWMTQNLDLDIDDDITYTHWDTDLGWNNPSALDISAKWKPTSGHSTIDFSDVGINSDNYIDNLDGWGKSNTEPYSADPGDVYHYNNGDTDTQYNSLAECQSNGHSDCEHYRIGNYYNWSSAVASNDTSDISIQYQDAPASICPAGWRLPIGRNSDDNQDTREFNRLFYISNIANGNPIVDSGWTDNGFNKIIIKPYYMVTSGMFNGRNLISLSAGNYWTRTIDGSTYAYFLVFNKNFISTDSYYYNQRLSGFSVRCLLR